MTDWKDNIKSSYAHKNFGFVGPDKLTRSDINIIDKKISNTNSAINTEVILLRKPTINALLTDYRWSINRTTSVLGIAIFSDDNWRSVYNISTFPSEDLDGVAVFQKAMILTSTNIPAWIVYGDEVINRKIDVSVKLKKIDFSNLPNSVLTEFTTYIKNGNKLEYGIDDTFISRLNDNVIIEEELPPHVAEMIIDDNIIDSVQHSRELGRIEADEITQVLGQISKGLISVAGQISSDIGTALEVAKFVGETITNIADSTDMAVFNSTTVPTGKILQKEITMDENQIYVRTLDFIHLHGDASGVPFNPRLSDSVITAGTVTVTHPASIYSEFAGDFTLSKLRTEINKRLLKNVQLQTSKFYSEIIEKQFPDKLGKAGVIFAGSPIDLLPPSESFNTANFKTYTHPSTDTATIPQRDRVYMQYKLKLNIDLANYEFPEPDVAGDFNEGETFNSLWVDDMPFGFYVNGRWYYTRYASDLPYTPPIL